MFTIGTSVASVATAWIGEIDSILKFNFIFIWFRVFFLFLFCFIYAVLVLLGLANVLYTFILYVDDLGFMDSYINNLRTGLCMLVLAL